MMDVETSLLRKSRFAEERGGGYLLFCRDEALAQSLPFSEGREGKEQLQRYFGEPMGRHDSLGKYLPRSEPAPTRPNSQSDHQTLPFVFSHTKRN